MTTTHLESALLALVQPAGSQGTDVWWSFWTGCGYKHKDCPALVSRMSKNQLKRWRREGLVKGSGKHISWTGKGYEAAEPADAMYHAEKAAVESGKNTLRCNYCGDISCVDTETLHGWFKRLHKRAQKRPDLVYLLATCNPQRLWNKLSSLELAMQDWPDNLGIETSARNVKQAKRRVASLELFPTGIRGLRLQPWCDRGQSADELDLTYISYVILGGYIGPGGGPLSTEEFEEQALQILQVCNEHNVACDFRTTGGTKVRLAQQARDEIVDAWLEALHHRHYFEEIEQPVVQYNQLWQL